MLGYLREGKNLSKDQSSIQDYLSFLYPKNTFIYDKVVPKEVMEARGASDFKRYRPDARCEELDLIVEVDGLPHYTRNSCILSDRIRDKYFRELGYKVVRIPYWLPLNKEALSYLFSKSVDEEICNKLQNFYDTPYNGLDCCIGGMVLAGQGLFIEQFINFPQSVQSLILTDIIKCREANKVNCEAICPTVFLKNLFFYAKIDYPNE